MPPKRQSSPKSKEMEWNLQPIEVQDELCIILENFGESKEMQRIEQTGKLYSMKVAPVAQPIGTESDIDEN